MKLKTLQIVGDSAYGGASYLILEWCRYLIDKGWIVDVVATDSYFYKKLKTIDGLRIIDDIFIPRDISLINDFRSFNKIWELLKAQQYDVVHTYTATPSFIGRLASRLCGIKKIFHHQAGWTVNEFSSFIEKIIYIPLESIAVNAGTKSICVSQAVYEQRKVLKFVSDNKYCIVKNGINPVPFLNDGIKKNKNNDFFTICSTGRLSKQKDIKTLILAFCELRKISDKLKLKIAGEGEEKPSLIELVIKLGLGEDIEFSGFVEDVPSFLSESDIFVTTSLWEGLSISLMEAMAATKPIVSSSILPNAELIQHEVNGLLFEPRNVEELAHQIRRYVRDREFASSMAKNAREEILKNYTLDRMLDETYELYIA